MKAGRELDALVAKKVMGWKLVGDTWFDGDRETRWRTDSPYFSGDWDTWNPSTDITAAWEILNSIHALGWQWEIGTNGFWAAEHGDHGIYCQIDDKEGRETLIHAETEPLAICLAALKAVGWTGESK